MNLTPEQRNQLATELKTLAANYSELTVGLMVAGSGRAMCSLRLISETFEFRRTESA